MDIAQVYRLPHSWNWDCAFDWNV